MGNVSLYHNSHQTFFRSPFGAVAVGTRVSVRLEIVSPAAPAGVWLRCWQEPEGERRLPMSEETLEGERRIFRCPLVTPDLPGLLWYSFAAEFSDRMYYYGAQPDGLGGAGQQYDGEPAFSFQLTVYAVDTTSPDWFKETILYQIFPDRFCNGNADGSVLNPPRGSLIHPYWEDTPFYVRDMRTGAIFAYDFFGGNLQGVLAKLPYLKELGIGAVYLNPIFESPSNHRYDTGDYKQVDPMLGDNQLFALLCAQAREKGIRFILDGVFSHTGSDSRYFNREGRYPEPGAYQSTESPYFSWYRFSDHPEHYESWWGIGTMPNVNEMEASYLRFIMEDNDSVVRHWFKAGIKGWRLDVADELPDEFIKRLRRVMKEADADSVLIGEVWEDASRKTSYGSTRQYLLGDELDSVMNYPFRSCLIDFMLGRQDAGQAQRLLTSQFENYPCQHFYAAMNLLGSHDVPRVLTLLGEAPPPEELSIIDQAKYRLPPAKRQLAVRRLKLLVLWQMTFPGAPCIYYGDEAGAEGYTDPFNRGTYPWGREEPELLDWYRQCIGLRNRYAVLRTGEWLPLPVSGDVYGYARRIRAGRDVFGRSRPDNYAVMLLNRSVEHNHTATYAIGENCRDSLYDAFDNSPVKLPEGELSLVLPPLTGRLLIARREGAGV